MTETHTIRPMTEDDLPAVMAIDGAVGWRHDEERFRYLLAAPDTRGLIVEDAEDDGAVGGFAFMGLREPVGWLGPVAVDPARGGRGLGTALVREADRSFREDERCDSAILEAYEWNRRAIDLYDRIGFVVTGVADSFGTPEGAAPLVPPSALDDPAADNRWITPLTEDDLPFLAALDDSYYGGWREDDLLYWLGAGLDHARLLRRGDEPIGYCLVEETTGRLGPAAAPTLPDFLALLDAILPLMPHGEGAPTHAVNLRLVDPTPAAVAALAARGLVLAPGRRNVRMEKVYRRPARRMGGIYVSARPEKG